MKRVIILAYILCAGIWTSHAQVRIVNSANNTGLNDSPAFIDASSNTPVNGSPNVGKGLIFPRVDLQALTAFPGPTAGIPNNFPTHYDGMIVYNTAISGTAGVGSTEGTLSPGFWYYENKSATNTGGTWKPLGGSSAEVDGIVGNEVTDATANGGLTRDGSGTADDPYTLGIATNGVNAGRIAANAVTTAKINGLAVTLEKLADNSVNAAKIVDGAVGTADLANNAVTSTKIADGAVGTAALAADAVNSSKIANGTILGEDLNSMGATTGQVLSFDGVAWAPAEPAIATVLSAMRWEMCSGPNSCSVSPPSGWSCGLVSGGRSTYGAHPAVQTDAVTCKAYGSDGVRCTFLCFK